MRRAPGHSLQVHLERLTGTPAEAVQAMPIARSNQPESRTGTDAREAGEKWPRNGNVAGHLLDDRQSLLDAMVLELRKPERMRFASPRTRLVSGWMPVPSGLRRFGPTTNCAPAGLEICPPLTVAVIQATVSSAHPSVPRCMGRLPPSHEADAEAATHHPQPG